MKCIFFITPSMKSTLLSSLEWNVHYLSHILNEMYILYHINILDHLLNEFRVVFQCLLDRWSRSFVTIVVQQHRVVYLAFRHVLSIRSGAPVRRYSGTRTPFSDRVWGCAGVSPSLARVTVVPASLRSDLLGSTHYMKWQIAWSIYGTQVCSHRRSGLKDQRPNSNTSSGQRGEGEGGTTI